MFKSKKLLLLLLLAMLLVALAACGGTADTPADNADTPATDGNAESFLFTDSAGREVEVASQISRIVPTGPMAQMVLLSIAPDLMVGIANEWGAAEPYVAEQYRTIPVIGQLYGGKGDLNLEEIAAVDSQLIIDIGEAKDTIVEDMDGLTAQTGITAVHINASLANMAETYRMLGELLGRQEKGEELALYCEEIYSRAMGIMEQVGENKISVVHCLGDAGLNVIAQGSYHAELLDILTNNGAVLDDPSSKGTGNEVDLEQLLVWDPQVILFTNGSVYDQVGADAAWLQLSAIKNGAYYEIPFGPYNWLGSPPSINRYLGLMWLPAVLYPDYVDYDLYTEAARYYQLFYDYELTQEEFDTLTAKAL